MSAGNTVEKYGATVTTVDVPHKVVEFALKTATARRFTLATYPTIFTWPQVGDEIMVRYENGQWSLEGWFDQDGTYQGVNPGDAVIHSGTGTVWVKGSGANDFSFDNRFGWDPGDLKPSAAASPGAGWLLCDGSAVSRITYAALFARIGTSYGAGNGSTTFNVPDMQGRLPIGAGTGSAAGATAWTLGQMPLSGPGGEQTHTLSIAEMPSHNHGGLTGTSTTGTGTTGTGTSGSATADLGGNVPMSTGGVWAFENPATGSGAAQVPYRDNSYTNITNTQGHTHSIPGLSVPGLSVPALSISNQGGGSAHNILPPVTVVNWFIKT